MSGNVEHVERAEPTLPQKVSQAVLHPVVDAVDAALYHAGVHRRDSFSRGLVALGVVLLGGAGAATIGATLGVKAAVSAWMEAS